MYNVRLPNFEGPLDLLLFFIRRDELDIYDIPIAYITREFLEYIRLMELLDLELAGEFLVMAAALMQIKVRMLLPKEEKEGEEAQEEEDPRAELVRKLLEYKRYKEMAGTLGAMNEEQRYAYYRQFFKGDVVASDSNEEDLLRNVTLFHLLAAFKKALARAPRDVNPHRIEQIAVTVEEQADFILSHFQTRRQLTFSELCSTMPRVVMVVTFLAVLELIRSNRVGIRQEEAFGEILLFEP